MPLQLKIQMPKWRGIILIQESQLRITGVLRNLAGLGRGVKPNIWFMFYKRKAPYPIPKLQEYMSCYVCHHYICCKNIILPPVYIYKMFLFSVLKVK